MYDNVFNILLSKIQQWLIPTMLRQPVLMAFIQAIYTPLVALHNSFINYRSAKFYQIKMNYQVCYLASFLNDRFDSVQRRIYIDDALTVDQVYAYQDEEETPLWLYQDDEEETGTFLFQDGESLGDILFDFVVFIPSVVSYDENEVRAMIATKLCGKKYKIERF
jgi:hypothetical protein